MHSWFLLSQLCRSVELCRSWKRCASFESKNDANSASDEERFAWGPSSRHPPEKTQVVSSGARRCCRYECETGSHRRVDAPLIHRSRATNSFFRVHACKLVQLLRNHRRCSVQIAPADLLHTPVPSSEINARVSLRCPPLVPPSLDRSRSGWASPYRGGY